MKDTIVASIFLVMILVFVMFSFLFLQKSTNEFTKNAYNIEVLCIKEDYVKAYTETKIFKEKWNEMAPIYYTFLPHAGVLEVTFCAENLLIYIHTQDVPLMLSEVKRLQLLIDRIVSDEILDVGNLL